MVVVGAPAASAAPAFVPEAGNGISVTSLTRTSPTVVSWSGTYSCTGSTPAVLVAIATSGKLAVTTNLKGMACPATDKIISGKFTTLLGQAWGTRVKFDFTLTTVLDLQADTEQASLDGNAEGIATFEEVELDLSGAAEMIGEYSCPIAEPSVTATITATQSTSSGKASGKTTRTLPCPATPGTRATYAIMVTSTTGVPFQTTTTDAPSLRPNASDSPAAFSQGLDGGISMPAEPAVIESAVSEIDVPEGAPIGNN
jgi:hypothetical protein